MDGSAVSTVVLQLVAPVMPAFYTAFAAVIAKIICPAFLKRPFQDLTRPDKYSVENAVDVRIPGASPDEWLGAWMIRPPVVGKSEGRLIFLVFIMEIHKVKGSLRLVLG